MVREMGRDTSVTEVLRLPHPTQTLCPHTLHSYMHPRGCTGASQCPEVQA